MTLLYLLITIAIVYIIYLSLSKQIESYSNITNESYDDFKGKLKFYSNQYTYPEEIYDKFMYFMYDGICFSEKMYHEQYIIIMTILNRNNSYINTIFIDGECAPHLPIMFNFENTNIKCRAISKQFSNILTKKFDKQIEIVDNTPKQNSFNCYVCFSHFMYYKSNSELRTYLNDIVSNMLQHGIVVFNVINDWNIKTLYGYSNNDLNYFNMNYKIQTQSIQNTDIFSFDEIITDLQTNKSRTNKHALYKHSINDIVDLCKDIGLHNTHKRELDNKKNYSVLIFKKVI